jgi:hypothetical protein
VQKQKLLDAGLHLLSLWTDRFGNRHEISWGAIFLGIVRKNAEGFASIASDSPRE